jgi:MerR family transcriptional regulator/heat shock protein HspR
MKNTLTIAKETENESVYSIGTVARMLQVSVQLLRLYEKEGLILPLRSDGKQRLYSESDIARLRCIISAIREEKMTIASIQRIQSLIPCWKMQNCQEQDRLACPAFSTAGKPCWSIKLNVDACGMASCRECNVYIRSSDCTTIKQFIIDATKTESPSQ